MCCSCRFGIPHARVLLHSKVRACCCHHCCRCSSNWSGRDPANVERPKYVLSLTTLVCRCYIAWWFNTLYTITGIELIPFGTTFFCCLFINIEYGILIGIQVHLILLLYEATRSTSDFRTVKVVYRLRYSFSRILMQWIFLNIERPERMDYRESE